MQTVRTLFQKYKELILYIVFGVLTTLVNLVAYVVCTRLFSIHEVAATAIGWFLSVLFAFVTNKKWVFEDRETTWQAVLKQGVSFFAARGATGLMDMAIIFLFVTLWGMPDIVIKIVSNVLVIVINYVLSKLLIFRKKRSDG